MTLDQKTQIRKCFDYQKQSLSEIIDVSDNEVYIVPNSYWDLDWVTVKEENNKYTLKWKWKGKEKEFAESNLSFAQVKKMLNFYK